MTESGMRLLGAVSEVLPTLPQLLATCLSRQTPERQPSPDQRRLHVASKMTVTRACGVLQLIHSR